MIFPRKYLSKIVKCLSHNLTKILGLVRVVVVIIAHPKQMISVLMAVDTVLGITLIDNLVGSVRNVILKIQQRCSVVLTAMGATIDSLWMNCGKLYTIKKIDS